MQARRCPACDRELVKDAGEDAYHFARRVTCGQKGCFSYVCREVNRKRADLREQAEREEVERRTAELREAKRAEWIAEGCTLTDNLD